MINKKNGSALMQVLVLGGVIAGVVILLLRFSLVRASNVVKTSRKISAKAFTEGCMADLTARAMMNELYGRPPSIAGSTQFTCQYNVNLGSPAVARSATADVDWLWVPNLKALTLTIPQEQVFLQRPLYKLTFTVPTHTDDRWQ